MHKTYVPNALKVDTEWVAHIINRLTVNECRILDQYKIITGTSMKQESWIQINSETKPLLIKAGALIPLMPI